MVLVVPDPGHLTLRKLVFLLDSCCKQNSHIPSHNSTFWSFKICRKLGAIDLFTVVVVYLWEGLPEWFPIAFFGFIPAGSLCADVVCIHLFWIRFCYASFDPPRVFYIHAIHHIWWAFPYTPPRQSARWGTSNPTLGLPLLPTFIFHIFHTLIFFSTRLFTFFLFIQFTIFFIFTIYQFLSWINQLYSSSAMLYNNNIFVLIKSDFRFIFLIMRSIYL